MMRKFLPGLLLIACLIITGFSPAPQPNIQVIRKQLVSAINCSQTTDSLYNTLESIKQPSALIVGYIGALEALKAKHTWNPYNKIKYLSSCERTISRAVLQDPHSIEIRFIRFSIEHNIPGFLGYNKNISDDKEEMIRQIQLRNYDHSDKDVVVSAIRFMMDSKQCSLKENDVLHKQLDDLK